MIISKQYKFLFIHIPKTGGTSVWKSLLDVGGHNARDCHIGAKKMKNMIGEKRWNEYFKFAFVRNPWARMVSCFEYDKMIGSPNAKKYNTFPRYLKYRLIDQPRERDGYFFYRMLDRIEIDNKIAMDYVGKCETLQKDFDYVCDKLGVSKRKLGNERQTKKVDYRTYYDKKSIKIVSDMFSREIEVFNYEF